MTDALMLLACLLACAALLLLPWMICWGSFWWTRLHYANAVEERLTARVVRLHDAMPYLHNRWGHAVEPLTPLSWYYATFKTKSGALLRFRIDQEAYYRLSLGSEGTLTCRKKLFVSFEPAQLRQDAIFVDHE